MSNERINLLPPERCRALRRDYFMRLFVVATLLVATLLFISAILLLPTYVFLAGSANAEKIHLANIESSTSSSEEKSISAQLTVLSESATTLSKLSGTRPVSTIIKTFLAIARPGISLSGFVYSPVTNKGPNTLTISGTAATRDALRSYQLALQKSPLALSANMPVSVYAEDADIDFTIAISLAP